MATIEIVGDLNGTPGAKDVMQQLVVAWQPGHTVWVARGLSLEGPRRPLLARSADVRIRWGLKGAQAGEWVVVPNVGATAPSIPSGIDVITLSVRARHVLDQTGSPQTVHVLPLPIPDQFYAPGDRALVWDATQSLRLEERPRIVYAGSYTDGSEMSHVLDAASRLLVSGGELLLLDGLPLRARLAPVVHHLGLADKVIFTPTLTMDLLAGVYHGADILIGGNADRLFPVAAHYAMAAGLPVIGWHTPLMEDLTGRGALFVHNDKMWKEAIVEVLENGRIRERMIERGLAYAKERHLRDVADTWLSTIGVG